MATYECAHDYEPDEFEKVEASKASAAAITFWAGTDEGDADYGDVIVKDEKGVITRFRVSRRTEYDARQVRS
jgi:hypothetical protein